MEFEKHTHDQNQSEMNRLRMIYHLISCGLVDQGRQLLKNETDSEFTTIGVSMYRELVWAFSDLQSSQGLGWENAEQALMRIEHVVHMAREARVKIRDPKYLLARVLALKVLSEDHPDHMKRIKAHSSCVHFAQMGIERYPEMQFFEWILFHVQGPVS